MNKSICVLFNPVEVKVDLFAVVSHNHLILYPHCLYCVCVLFSNNNCMCECHSMAMFNSHGLLQNFPDFFC